MNRINKVLQWNYVTAKYASKNIDKIWFARFTNRLTQFTIQMKMFLSLI